MVANGARLTRRISAIKGWLSGHVGEITGAFLSALFGIMPTVRHADYIATWLEVLCDDNRAIVRAASSASKAADYLLAFRPGNAAQATSVVVPETV